MFDLTRRTPPDAVGHSGYAEAESTEIGFDELWWLYENLVGKVVRGENVDASQLAAVMSALGIPPEQLTADIDTAREDINESHQQGQASRFDDPKTQLALMFQQAKLALA